MNVTQWTRAISLAAMLSLTLALALATFGQARAGDLDWSRISTRTMPAIVVLEPETGERRLGSGFVIAAEGYVLTNAHVVGRAEIVTVAFENGARLRGEVLNADPWVDLAVVRVHPAKPLPHLTLGHMEDVRRGQPVAAVGSPLSYPFSISRGIVSGLDRTFVEQDAVGYLQHDAAINPGNSGGPVLDRRGRVLGINTATPDEARYSIGIGLAIPVDIIEAYWRRQTTGEGFAHAALDIRVRPLTPQLVRAMGLNETAGLLVEYVAPTLSGFNAGLHVGDVIIAMDDRPLTSPRQLGAALWRLPPGAKTNLRVTRGAARLSLDAVLGQAQSRVDAFQRPTVTKIRPPGAKASFGLSLAYQRLNEGDAITVSEVASGSAAASAGLEPGDRILALNGQLVDRLETAAATLSNPDVDVVVALVARGEDEQRLVMLHQMSADQSAGAAIF